MTTKIHFLIEQFLPFLIYFVNKRKKRKTIEAQEKQFNKKAEEIIEIYCELPVEVLKSRLEEEHIRAVKIDEKTVKFTLGLSIGLTVLSTASGSLANLLPESTIRSAVVLLCGTSSTFMLIAGIISLGALKTLPKYGYGTFHALALTNKKLIEKHLSEQLFLQESINIIRHLRNEAAYQCLRNGFYILLIALILSLFFIKSSSPRCVTETTRSTIEKTANSATLATEPFKCFSGANIHSIEIGSEDKISKLSAFLLGYFANSGKEPTEEEKSMAEQLARSFFDGYLNKAGASGFDSTVSFFKYLKNSTFPGAKEEKIYFDVDSYAIRRSGKNKLIKLCKEIQKDQNNLLITGYTDRQGSYQYNTLLAENRQEAVRQWLTDECKSYNGTINLTKRYQYPPVPTLFGVSEPENRVVTIIHPFKNND